MFKLACLAPSSNSLELSPPKREKDYDTEEHIVTVNCDAGSKPNMKRGSSGYIA
ncbi:conserved hypothetical protein [Ricinus communis]|uniref:Uncharacterized protein n=1 Tax=Ricinus communis TaxID=3988 RepID=B9RQD1_RICCO|nr:conserved hypothetical protein [Ricinus communis]